VVHRVFVCMVLSFLDTNPGKHTSYSVGLWPGVYTGCANAGQDGMFSDISCLTAHRWKRVSPLVSA
jgi:hypothetical protein